MVEPLRAPASCTIPQSVIICPWQRTGSCVVGVGVWDSGTSPDPHHWAQATGPRRTVPELPRPPALRAGHRAAKSWPPRSSTSWRCPLRTCATAHRTIFHSLTAHKRNTREAHPTIHYTLRRHHGLEPRRSALRGNGAESSPTGSGAVPAFRSLSACTLNHCDYYYWHAPSAVIFRASVFINVSS